MCRVICHIIYINTFMSYYILCKAVLYGILYCILPLYYMSSGSYIVTEVAEARTKTRLCVVLYFISRTMLCYKISEGRYNMSSYILCVLLYVISYTYIHMCHIIYYVRHIYIRDIIYYVGLYWTYMYICI